MSLTRFHAQSSPTKGTDEVDSEERTPLLLGDGRRAISRVPGGCGVRVTPGRTEASVVQGPRGWRVGILGGQQWSVILLSIRAGGLARPWKVTDECGGLWAAGVGTLPRLRGQGCGLSRLTWLSYSSFPKTPGATSCVPDARWSRASRLAGAPEPLPSQRPRHGVNKATASPFTVPGDGAAPRAEQ